MTGVVTRERAVELLACKVRPCALRAGRCGQCEACFLTGDAPDELRDAAPDLAATVVAQADELRGIAAALDLADGEGMGHALSAVLTLHADRAAMAKDLKHLEMRRFDAAHSAEQWEESATLEKARADAMADELARLREGARSTAPAALVLGDLLTGHRADMESVNGFPDSVWRKICNEVMRAVNDRSVAREENERLRSLASRVCGALGSITNHHGLRSDKAEAIASLDADVADSLARMEAEVARLRVSRDALRAIVEGRTVPPTDAEIAAHSAAGGRWLIASPLMGRVSLASPPTADAARSLAGGAAAGWWAPDALTWWALDRSGRPCPWPTTPALPGAGGGGR